MLKPKRLYKEDTTGLVIKHEITQLILHIFTNVSVNKIQFLNINNYEKHVVKAMHKDKGYVHNSIKSLITCTTEFIRVIFIYLGTI
jgi:hypothetical protein